MKSKARAIEKLDPLIHIPHPVSEGLVILRQLLVHLVNLLLGHTRPRIGKGEIHHIPLTHRLKRNVPFLPLLNLNAMVNRILHQRLQRKLRDHRPSAVLPKPDFHPDNVVVPHILDNQVIPHMLNLHFQRDYVVPPA